MADPTYLIVRTRAPHRRFQAFCAAIGHAGGTLVAARSLHDVTALEPGSVPLHIWIAKYPSMEAAKAAWAGMDASLISEPEVPLVLAAKAVPAAGFPPEMDFVPTHKNVNAGPSTPPTLMLIEGSASDQGKMDQYRDIILPLMRSQDAYYICFELGGDIAILSGDWNDAIFAISRWPEAHRAKAFWLSNTYQDEAIPLRLNIGTFSVLTFEGERDG